MMALMVYNALRGLGCRPALAYRLAYRPTPSRLCGSHRPVFPISSTGLLWAGLKAPWGHNM